MGCFRRVVLLYLSDEQYAVQELVDRRATSSYYTSKDGIAVIREFVKLIDDREGIVLADPFMGSGVTLSSVNDLVRPSKVIGIEINREPCELGRRILSSLYTNVEVVCGDAFKVAWRYRADLVITNPPFVRWSLLNKGYREELLRIMEEMGYGSLISRRDPGLHILSFFLIDGMLRDGGYVITVMPASALYTSQGEGLRRLLKARYQVLGIVENKRGPSFSVGSGFKELILFLRKRGAGDSVVNERTVIYRWDGKLSSIGSVNIHALPRFADRNWLSLFNIDIANKLIEIIEYGLETGLLRYLGRDEIVRGVEMYGPDFFFLPNRHWSIVGRDGDYVIIRNSDGQRLSIHRKYLVECLRKPEYYNYEVEIRDPGFYALAINDDPEGDLRRYIEWGERQGVPALKFGRHWYRHVWRQLQSKRPYGHIFIHDKLDLERHGVLANYSQKPLCASKNFYIVRTNNPLIAAWYNSTLMRLFLKVFSRKISEKWTRFLEEDYLAIPVPTETIEKIDFRNIDKTIEDYLCKDEKCRDTLKELTKAFREG
ncbi:MAG: N-6 DNA methylase [Vulcanisaeta sp.]|nr:N-6 DNA methylase [Vulcanisaeta sp.]